MESRTDRIDNIHNVPPEGTRGACDFCLGTCGLGYSLCHKCDRDWFPQLPEVEDACDLIVPCTVAISPSPWYTAMSQYKRGSRRDDILLVARVLNVWLRNHMGRVTEAIEGPPTMAAVVPSTSALMPTPLYQIVSQQPMLRAPVSSSAVKYVDPSVSWKRKYLSPESFSVDSEEVSGQRMILVEDTWVTGSTALSAAIAIRRAGADKLALIMIARMVNKYYVMTDDYQEAIRPPYDPERFPRQRNDALGLSQS